MEGAVLKKRLDDIFDITKYTKALHKVRQIEKDDMSKVETLEAELAAFRAHKQAAHDKQLKTLGNIEEAKKEVSANAEEEVVRELEVS